MHKYHLQCWLRRERLEERRIPVMAKDDTHAIAIAQEFVASRMDAKDVQVSVGLRNGRRHHMHFRAYTLDDAEVL
jgi:hypothetical protein